MATAAQSTATTKAEPQKGKGRPKGSTNEVSNKDIAAMIAENNQQHAANMGALVSRIDGLEALVATRPVGRGRGNRIPLGEIPLDEAGAEKYKKQTAKTGIGESFTMRKSEFYGAKMVEVIFHKPDVPYDPSDKNTSLFPEQPLFHVLTGVKSGGMGRGRFDHSRNVWAIAPSDLRDLDEANGDNSFTDYYNENIALLT